MTATTRGIPLDADDPGPDVLDLTKMRFMSAGSVLVPQFGLLELNEWSRRQLGTELGVNWDKFFSNTPTDQIQQAVTNHLRSRDKPLLQKIIARSFDKGETPKSPASNGVLRAFVSTRYTEIRDFRIFQRMEESIKNNLGDMHFKTVSFTPNASHFFLTFNEPFNVLKNHKDMAMAAADEYYFGIRVRNSEVGGGPFAGYPWYMKFICSNGAIVGIEEGPLLYRTHRSINDEDLDGMIKKMFRELPERRERLIKQAGILHEIAIENPLEHLKDFLKGQPKAIVEAAETAWKQEGEPSNAFGISQTISRMAMAMRHNRDRQFDMEKLAGDYIRKTVKYN